MQLTIGRKEPTDEASAYLMLGTEAKNSAALKEPYMFKKALVGLDLSPAERPMMDCLSDLRRWGIEEIVLTHIIHVAYIDSGGYGHKDEYAARLAERVETLRSEGFQASIEVRYGGVVADELLTAATDEAADLLVIGSRGHNLIHDVFLGSVAKAVVRKSTLPVLLERIKPTVKETEVVCAAVCGQKLTTLLLATDFSEHAQRAETIAMDLAQLANTSYFLSVIEPDDHSRSAVGESDTARAKLERIKEQTGDFADRIEIITNSGEPAAVIAQVAENIHATLIIVGKHGHGWQPKSIIGHVAEHVCVLAKRPVLMIPHS